MQVLKIRSSPFLLISGLGLTSSLTSDEPWPICDRAWMPEMCHKQTHLHPPAYEPIGTKVDFSFRRKLRSYHFPCRAFWAAAILSILLASNGRPLSACRSLAIKPMSRSCFSESELIVAFNLRRFHCSLKTLLSQANAPQLHEFPYISLKMDIQSHEICLSHTLLDICIEPVA